MKSKNLQKRLVLKKETVAHLSDNDMQRAYGGGVTKPPTRCDCPTGETCPTKIMVHCTT